MDGRTLWEIGQWLSATVAFAAGCRHRQMRLEPTNVLEGQAYFEDTIWKNDLPCSVRVGAALRTPMAFSLTLAAGVAQPHAPTAPGVHPKLPIAGMVSDDPRLVDVLAGDGTTASAIGTLAAIGATAISADGDAVWAYRDSAGLAERDIVQPLLNLRDGLAGVASLVSTSARGLRRRIIALEGLEWCLISFAVTNTLGLMARVPDPFVDFTRYLTVGIGASLVLLFAILGVVCAMFGWSWNTSARFSLRGISALLLIGIWAMGFSIVSMVNSAFDQSAPLVFTKPIVSLDIHWRDDKSLYDVFFNLFKPPQCDITVAPQAEDPIKLPVKLEVPTAQFCRATPPQEVTFRIGRGALGIPWYRSVTPQQGASRLPSVGQR